VSLTTYPELKIAIADWMERGDLAARAGDFVALAESRLNRLLRSPALEREATVTVAQGDGPRRLRPICANPCGSGWTGTERRPSCPTGTPETCRARGRRGSREPGPWTADASGSSAWRTGPAA